MKFTEWRWNCCLQSSKCAKVERIPITLWRFAAFCKNYSQALNFWATKRIKTVQKSKDQGLGVHDHYIFEMIFLVAVFMCQTQKFVPEIGQKKFKMQFLPKGPLKDFHFRLFEIPRPCTFTQKWPNMVDNSFSSTHPQDNCV